MADQDSFFDALPFDHRHYTPDMLRGFELGMLWVRMEYEASIRSVTRTPNLPLVKGMADIRGHKIGILSNDKDNRVTEFELVLPEPVQVDDDGMPWEYADDPNSAKYGGDETTYSTEHKGQVLKIIQGGKQDGEART